MSTNDFTDLLFPLPSPAPSNQCPERIPGATHETGLAVVKALKDNHARFHAFRNEQGLHNHMSHQLLAAFAMGGSTPLYDTIYKKHEPELLTAFQSPEEVTAENYHKFFGNREYYDAYLEYFHRVVFELGFPTTLQEYIFSRDANYPETGAPRRMVNRLLARSFNPMISLGYGLEFGIPGLVAEGLAQMAVHPEEAPSLLLASDFEIPEDAADAPDLSPLRPGFSAMALNVRKKSSFTLKCLQGDKKPVVHAFTVLERIIKDDRFKSSALNLKPHEGQFEAAHLLEHVGKEVGNAIVECTSDWLPNEAGAYILESKVEELCWLSTLLYGVSGYQTAGFIADFYLMRTITASVFLPSFLAYLSPSTSIVLLRTFLRTTLAWYVARGRPALPIREFYAGTTPSRAPKPEGMLTDAVAANPWLPLIQQALAHGDDQLPTIQRALAHFAKIYGDRAARAFGDLDGAELVDGTLFLRVAELTGKSMEKPGCAWDFGGSFQ